MSRHPIPPDVDINSLKAQVTRQIREPSVLHENMPENGPTALEFTPNLTVGEVATLATILDHLDPDTVSTLRTLVITTAQGAVGITVDQLTIGQTRALVAILLWKAGALTPTGAVKPLNQWV